ncbi:hypothetical protein ACJIZ3_022842 [Penstemon smallii]|uniref:Uncharacterized protein n=1 Tax=Penstemon smallii TaxID=265156 RepID=A0ABD3TME7_9LAMI
MSICENDKTCGICSETAITGQGQAIFEAECSHSFHFICIWNYALHGNKFCPICHAKLNDIPFSFPNSNISPNNANYVPSFSYTTFSFHVDLEPYRFSDDEPLLERTPTIANISLNKAIIKAIPERPAIAASESISQFSVLVGLKAPSLSDDACHLRAPIDLVTVLDVSGSMEGSKLALVKRAVNFVIDNLGPSDRISIVSFESHARRILPLSRMTEHGRNRAKRAVDLILAYGGTNIVEGLKKGVRVLEERHFKNPVTSIVFLSDGNDNCNDPEYQHLLPASICPRNRSTTEDDVQIFPVHAFGFGSDHDPIAMHAISDSSGGTFSFIESFEMVQDAFANCIGGLLSVVIQEARLVLKSASHGVEIKSIASGRYVSEISNQESEGVIKVGDLYADENREFLINLSVPILLNDVEGEENERKTSLLDITCSYEDVVSKESVRIEADLVEIRRPNSLSTLDMVVNLEVDRQRNRLLVSESIAEAQKMAERGNLTGARDLLSKGRSTLLASESGQAGDGLCMWLEAEVKETQERMGSTQLYEKSGRAFALSGMSSHSNKRASTRGNSVPGAALFGSAVPQSSFGGASGPVFGAYATPFMAKMVSKSQQLNKTEESSATPMEE